MRKTGARAVQNPNIHLPNRHLGIIADSGSGKSGILAKLLPGRGVRAVFWDPNNDHQAHGFDRLGDFIRALAKAHDNNLKTGAGFRVAYTGTETVKGFELWCAAVNAILDGSRLTYVVIEELAGATESAGTARKFFKKLINQGRKYGAMIAFTTQRPQEIPKTAFSQCKTYYLGIMDDHATRRYLIERLAISHCAGLFDQVSIGTFIEIDKIEKKPAVLKTFFRKK